MFCSRVHVLQIFLSVKCIIHTDGYGPLAPGGKELFLKKKAQLESRGRFSLLSP